MPRRDSAVPSGCFWAINTVTFSLGPAVHAVLSFRCTWLAVLKCAITVFSWLHGSLFQRYVAVSDMKGSLGVWDLHELKCISRLYVPGSPASVAAAIASTPGATNARDLSAHVSALFRLQNLHAHFPTVEDGPRLWISDAALRARVLVWVPALGSLLVPGRALGDVIVTNATSVGTIGSQSYIDELGAVSAGLATGTLSGAHGRGCLVALRVVGWSVARTDNIAHDIDSLNERTYDIIGPGDSQDAKSTAGGLLWKVQPRSIIFDLVCMVERKVLQ